MNIDPEAAADDYQELVFLPYCGFVELDTAPTDHPILLLEAAEAYRKQIFLLN